MGIQRNEIDITTIGPHYLDWQYQQYNLSNLTSASSSTIFYLPQANWLGGTSSKSDDYLVISDVKSGYIVNGQGPKVYAHPSDVASLYPVTINGKVVADSGVNISYYQLNRENTVYRVTYDSFYAYTIEDVLDGNGYIDVTYTDLRNLISSSGLIPGTHYRITDFATIYDRPDYYFDDVKKVSSQISTITATVQPIVVLATYYNTISEKAYQPAYPRDSIKYDINWTNTELKLTAAKGRITERIDEYGNRTDYDHRQITFKRYRDYDADGTTLAAVVSSINFSTGVATLSSGSVTAGNIVLIEYTSTNFPLGLKVLTTIPGVSFTFTTDPANTNYTGSVSGLFNLYVATSTTNFIRHREVYFGQGLSSSEYELRYTFDWVADMASFGKTASVSNYIGDSHEDVTNTEKFLLSNNVFGCNFKNNVTGTGFVNNTFGTTNSMVSGYESNAIDNTFGNGFRSNTLTAGADGAAVTQNTFGNGCYYNDIYGGLSFNTIGERFTINKSGSLDSNQIGSVYSYNGKFYLRTSLLSNNQIGPYFSTNIIRISSAFDSNTIGSSFAANTIRGRFTGNTIGSLFSHNDISSAAAFVSNTVGTEFNINIIEKDFSYNLIGSYFYNNRIQAAFNNNKIGNSFAGNIFGTTALTTDNVIGNGFDTNTISGKFQVNIIGNYFTNNPINFGMQSCSIDNGFDSNTINVPFSANNIGYGFASNTLNGPNEFLYNNISSNFLNNNINDYFNYNIIGHNFISNQIGDNFERNQIGDYFGNEMTAIGAFQNIIGDYFQDNVIGNYFGNDKAGDGGNLILNNFKNNHIGDNFIFNLLGDSVNTNNANFNSNRIGGDFSFNIIYDGFQGNEIGDVFLGNEIGDAATGVCNFDSNDIGNYFGINIIGQSFMNNEIGDYFGSDGTSTTIYQTIGSEFKNNHIRNYFGNDGTGTAGENNIGNTFQNNFIDTTQFINAKVGDGFKNNVIRYGANVNGLDFTFTPATHVYNNYTFIIDEYKNGAGTIAWGHWFDQPTLTPQYSDPTL